MAMTRAEHRDEAERLLRKYESCRYSEGTAKQLLQSIAHGLLAQGADETVTVDPFPAGLPQPTS